jgi:hypothetical protein
MSAYHSSCDPAAYQFAHICTLLRRLAAVQISVGGDTWIVWAMNPW